MAADIPQPRFDSVEAAIEALRYWPQELPFPLNDSLAPDLMIKACEIGTIKAAVDKRKLQESWKPRLEGQMAAGLLSYEDNAARLEKKLGWSSLSIWSVAFAHQRGLWSPHRQAEATMTREEMSASLKSLINSGASMELARWTDSGLPIRLINSGMLDEMVLLCEAGFDLNAPYAVGGYSSALDVSQNLYSFISACADIEALDKPEGQAALKTALSCALSQGVDLEARDTAGCTPLGLALLRAGDRSNSGESGYVKTLLELGADPSRVSRHPLALCANHKLLKGAALARAQQQCLEIEVRPSSALRGPRSGSSL